jgi:cytochrome c biogenesis protein CcmG/thiol:disulfide interchange protein DsbE
MPPTMAAPPRTPSHSSWQSTALVVALAVVVGASVLPRLVPGSAALVDHAAPDFALPVIHGGEPGNRLRLSDLKGRVVLLDFWASWCSACRKQAPILDAVAKRHRSDRLMVVGVNVQDTRSEAVRFARARALSYPSVADLDSSVARLYDASSVPLMVIVDKAGQVTAVRRGLVSAQQIEELLLEATSSASSTP